MDKRLDYFNPRLAASGALGPPPRGVYGGAEPWLHIRVIRSATTFGRHPDNILRRIFNVAGFAMDTVLRVYLQALQRPSDCGVGCVASASLYVLYYLAAGSLPPCTRLGG